MPDRNIDFLQDGMFGDYSLFSFFSGSVQLKNDYEMIINVALSNSGKGNINYHHNKSLLCQQ